MGLRVVVLWRLVKPWQETRMRDGRAWRIGREPDVAWINDGTEETLAIAHAVPPGFEAYWTLDVPYSGECDWSQEKVGRFPLGP